MTNEQTINTNAPVKEASQLDWFVGEWTIQSKMKNQEGGWDESVCYSDVSKMLGGHALLEKFWGELGGEQFNGISMRTYSPRNERWEQAWLDDSGKSIAVYWGEYDAKKHQFIGRNAASIMLDDPKLYTKETFFEITDDAFEWKLETSQDGEAWTTVWTLSYQRK